MKKILTILLLAIATTSYGQIAPPKRKINLNLPVPNTQSAPIGPIMMLGGASFIVAGILTPANMVAGSTTQKQPPINQMQKILPIVSGSIIFVAGVSVTIGNM